MPVLQAVKTKEWILINYGSDPDCNYNTRMGKLYSLGLWEFILIKGKGCLSGQGKAAPVEKRF